MPVPLHSAPWPEVAATVMPGHRVASGRNNDPRFPGGTLAMQRPFFEHLGLNISMFHPGTLNLSMAPHRYCVVAPRLTFRALKWHPTEPAEDFSFFDCHLRVEGGDPVAALIYYPHPETKPEHFQAPDVLEVLAPSIPGLGYGMQVMLGIDPSQMTIEVHPFDS